MVGRFWFAFLVLAACESSARNAAAVEFRCETGAYRIPNGVPADVVLDAYEAQCAHGRLVFRSNGDLARWMRANPGEAIPAGTMLRGAVLQAIEAPR